MFAIPDWYNHLPGSFFNIDTAYSDLVDNFEAEVFGMMCLNAAGCTQLDGPLCSWLLGGQDDDHNCGLLQWTFGGNFHDTASCVLFLLGTLGAADP